MDLRSPPAPKMRALCGEEASALLVLLDSPGALLCLVTLPRCWPVVHCKTAPGRSRLDPQVASCTACDVRGDGLEELPPRVLWTGLAVGENALRPASPTNKVLLASGAAGIGTEQVRSIFRWPWRARKPAAHHAPVSNGACGPGGVALPETTAFATLPPSPVFLLAAPLEPLRLFAAAAGTEVQFPCASSTPLGNQESLHDVRELIRPRADFLVGHEALAEERMFAMEAPFLNCPVARDSAPLEARLNGAPLGELVCVVDSRNNACGISSTGRSSANRAVWGDAC